MLTHNLFESIVEQVIVLKESKPTSSALVLNGLYTIRGHLVAALETRMILWVGLEFGKGLEFHAEYILNILYSNMI